MATRELTYIDPVTGFPTVIEAEDADLFGVGNEAARPAAGDYDGDLWLLLVDGRYVLQRWSGSSWVDLTLGGPGGHDAIDSLVHALAETSAGETTRTNGRITAVTIRALPGAPNIRRLEVTRTGGQVSQIVRRIYDPDGDELTAKRLTTTYTRTAGRVTSWVTTEGA